MVNLALVFCHLGFLDIVVETAQLETTGHGNHAIEV
jgi:hypothetical protein